MFYEEDNKIITTNDTALLVLLKKASELRKDKIEEIKIPYVPKKDSFDGYVNFAIRSLQNEGSSSIEVLKARLGEVLDVNQSYEIVDFRLESNDLNITDEDINELTCYIMSFAQKDLVPYVKPIKVPGDKPWENPWDKPWGQPGKIYCSNEDFYKEFVEKYNDEIDDSIDSDDIKIGRRVPILHDHIYSSYNSVFSKSKLEAIIPLYFKLKNIEISDDDLDCIIIALSLIRDEYKFRYPSKRAFEPVVKESTDEIVKRTLKDCVKHINNRRKVFHATIKTINYSAIYKHLYAFYKQSNIQNLKRLIKYCNNYKRDNDYKKFDKQVIKEIVDGIKGAITYNESEVLENSKQKVLK